VARILQQASSHKILGILTGLNEETKSPLSLIELASRTSYQSRDKITSGSAASFVQMIKKRGHESVLEHSALTVEFNNVSRGLTHELVRHRLASYTQESTRYVDESDLLVVIPPGKDADEKLLDLKTPEGDFLKVSFRDWVEMNEQMYRGLRKAGWLPQDARQILPIGIKSQIVVTTNFREWRHIFKLRCAPDAHWEIRETMLSLLQELKNKIPVIFDDFEIDETARTAKII